MSRGFLLPATLLRGVATDFLATDFLATDFLATDFFLGAAVRRRLGAEEENRPPNIDMPRDFFFAVTVPVDYLLSRGQQVCTSNHARFVELN